METHTFKGTVVQDKENSSWWLVDEQGNERIAADLLTGIDFSFNFNTIEGDEIEVTVRRKTIVES